MCWNYQYNPTLLEANGWKEVVDHGDNNDGAIFARRDTMGRWTLDPGFSLGQNTTGEVCDKEPSKTRSFEMGWGLMGMMRLEVQ
jgi:hypothetical protein